MPTARELLDQADALMRRNRSGTDDDEIPILTDAVPSLAEAPASVARIPKPRSAPPDDVPMLTEAVQEIEAVAIADVPSAEGEPSVWLDFDEAEPSVIGDAPDSIAIVPPVELRQSHAAALARVEAQAAAQLEAPAAAAVAGWEPAPAPSAPVREEPPLPPFTPTRAPEVAPIAASLLASAAPVVMSPTPAVAEHPPVAVAPVEPTPSTVNGLVGDHAQWAAVAEDVRMQVLQRIDLFTDTGLREQLALRLQPIVDRASADLVATINEHVGELLRTYVAEAIEREIERWRESH